MARTTPIGTFRRHLRNLISGLLTLPKVTINYTSIAQGVTSTDMAVDAAPTAVADQAATMANIETEEPAVEAAPLSQ